MIGCLTISHTSLLCLPSFTILWTLLFWSYLFVVGREVSWERWESSELEKWERHISVVRWQSGRIMKWHSRRSCKVVRWWFVKGGRVMRWQGGKDERVVRWQGGRFLVLFKGWGCRVRPRFHLFVYDANQWNEGAGCAQDIFAWPQGWKDFPKI